MATTGTVVALCVVFVLCINVNISEGLGLRDNVSTTYKCANDTAKTTELCLKDNLLKDYDNGFRPVPHHSNHTTVSMALFPTKIRIFFHSSNWMVLLCWVEKKWVDELLRWDPKEYKNLEQLTVNPKSIWRPDLSPLPFKGIESGTVKPQSSTISSNGSVYMAEYLTYYIPCKGDFSRWPYETLECVLTLQSEAYQGSVLDVILMHNETPVLKYYVEKKDLTLESMRAARITPETIDSKYLIVNIEYTFVITKKAAMFATVVVFPASVFLVTQLTFFFLNKESSARLILCGMALVSQCFFLAFTTKYIPNGGDTIPYIGFFYKYSLLLSASVLLWTITVRYICLYTGANVPYWLHKVVLRVNGNNFKPIEQNMGRDTEDQANQDAPAGCEQHQWQNVAQFLDRIVFIICLFVYLFLYVTYVSQ